jgi:predicted aminopeptidase
MNERERAPRKRRWMIWVLLAGAAVLFTGCRTMGFYRQALAGQWEIITHQQKIEKLIQDERTTPKLRRQLEYLQQVRNFAGVGLGLPVDGHYQKYVDLGRPFVVWNVQAAHEFSLEPKTWWYPMLGKLDYRGYFRQKDATNYARHLRDGGYEVNIGGVQAYSTLGWFRDPVLNTFLFLPDAELAELIFHELAHQVAFARGDTDFNEAFATCVGQEGVRRWLRSQGDTNALQAYEVSVDRNNQVVRLVLTARTELATLYGDRRGDDGKIKAGRQVSPEEEPDLRERKQRVLEDLRRQYRTLTSDWEGYRDYEGFFGVQLNNAHMNSVANYYDLVPGFERLLEANRGDLPAFYEAVRVLAKKHKTERRAQLPSKTQSGR